MAAELYGVFHEAEDCGSTLVSVHTSLAAARARVDQLAEERDDEGFCPYAACYAMRLVLNADSAYGPVVYIVHPLPDAGEEDDSSDADAGEKDAGEEDDSDADAGDEKGSS